MTRAVVDLDRDATVLDAIARAREAAADGDVVLVVPAGAPFARNAVFLDVARRLSEPRRIAIVTADARARSLASSVRVPAYATVAALDRGELDPTERLDRARAAALTSLPRRTAGASPRRVLGIAGSLLLASLIAAAVAVPDATVVVAAGAASLGPLEFELRAGPGGEITKSELSATVTAKVSGAASGSRTEDVKATGSVQLQNRQTFDIRIPKGTLFQTPQGVKFQSTEDRTLPRSVILFPITVSVGQVDVPVEAVLPGPGGNVPAGRITVAPSDQFAVSNRSPTSGGDTKKIPIVRTEDYNAARDRAPGEIQAAAERQLAVWRTSPKEGSAVFPKVFSKLTSLSAAADVVGKEIATFELAASGTATAFAYPATEPTQASLARLRSAASPGYALDEKSARVDVTRSDASEGGVITWSVRASGSQLARIDRDAIRRALAGHAPSEAAPTLSRIGVRTVQVQWWPGFWPRLPLLEGRIEVREVPAGP